MRELLVLALASTALVACGDDTIGATIGPWKVPVRREGFHRMCEVISGDGRRGGTICDEQLLDFEFVWGVEQHIRYRALQGDDYLQRCSPLAGECLQVVEVEERVTLPPGSPTTLPFPPTPTPWFAERDATSVTVADTPLGCDPICERLITVGGSGGMFEVDVALTGDATVPLHATAVRAQ